MVHVDTTSTTVLRKVVALAGVRSEEYALHSLNIGGATQLSARGATPAVLQREGRWALTSYANAELQRSVLSRVHSTTRE